MAGMRLAYRRIVLLLVGAYNGWTVPITAIDAICAWFRVKDLGNPSRLLIADDCAPVILARFSGLFAPVCFFNALQAKAIECLYPLSDLAFNQLYLCGNVLW